MKASSFISGKISFSSRAALVSIALSFLVIIIALATASGFRTAIKQSLSSVCGDLVIVPMSSYGATNSHFDSRQAYLQDLLTIEGVSSLSPVVYHSGVVKNGEDIHGVLFKGVDMPDSVEMNVVIPHKLSSLLGLNVGDKMLSYFVGEQVLVRKFKVDSIYDGIVTDDDKLVVCCDIDVLRRIAGIEEGQVSAIEVTLDERSRDDDASDTIRSEIAFKLYENAGEDGHSLICTRIRDSYPQIFDWLNLIDNNVTFVLILMIIVAGFNMVSGLLIMLFENISTIGLLKSMGMTDKAIAEVFLRCASRLVLCGMIIGNAIAFILCAIQDHFHLLTLNPENYFVSYLPVNLDCSSVLLCDGISFVAIMLILLIPCTFISKVDPSKTVALK